MMMPQGLARIASNGKLSPGPSVGNSFAAQSRGNMLQLRTGEQQPISVLQQLGINTKVCRRLSCSSSKSANISSLTNLVQMKPGTSHNNQNESHHCSNTLFDVDYLQMQYDNSQGSKKSAALQKQHQQREKTCDQLLGYLNSIEHLDRDVNPSHTSIADQRCSTQAIDLLQQMQSYAK